MEFCKDMLTNDSSGRGLKALKEELFDMNMTIKSYLDKGVSKDELEIAEGFKEAIAASEKAIDAVYKKSN